MTNQKSHAPGFIAFALYSDSTISRRTKSPTADSHHKGQWKMENNKITFFDITVNFSSVVIQTGSFDYNANDNTLIKVKWQQAGANLSGTFSNMQKIKLPTHNRIIWRVKSAPWVSKQKVWHKELPHKTQS